MRLRGVDKRGAREQTKRKLTVAQQFAALAQGSGVNRDAWFWASSWNGTALVDTFDAAHLLANNVGTLAAPVSDPAFNDALVSSFTGSQQVTSNRAASAWQFMHDGAGVTWFLVGAKITDAIGGRLFSNVVAAPGTDLLQDHVTLGAARWRVFSGGFGSVLSTIAAGNFTSTPCYVSGSYREGIPTPEWEFRAKSTLSTSGDSAGAPLAAAGDSFTIGGSGGADFANFKLAAFGAFHRVLTPGERSVVQSYIQSVTGIAP